MKTRRPSPTRYLRQAFRPSRETATSRRLGGPALLSIVIAAVFCAAACSDAAPQVDIDATIQAEVAAHLEAEATSQAVIAEGIQATMEAIPTQTYTPTPTLTPTPEPTPTYTPAPTHTPAPTNTPTYTPIPTNTPTHTPAPTHTPVPTSTPTFTPAPTSTPVPTNTPTHTPVPTSTPIPTSTPTHTPAPTSTPIPSSTPTRTPAPTSTPTPSILYEPTSGSIDIDDGSGYFDSNTDVADFMTSATFRIPSITVDDPSWAAGFLIRTITDRQLARGVDYRAHAIIIGLSGNWVHSILQEGEEEFELAQEAFSSNINTNPNSENQIRVIAQGTRGWLFINRAYEAEIDLSGITDSGTVSLGAWSDATTTRFHDFTVREIRKEYGPRNGSIQHDPDDGLIDGHDSFTSLQNGIIEAQFSNPYSEREGDWSSGFLFRHNGPRQFHGVVVNESARWYHGLRTGDADHEQELASDVNSAYISTGSTGTNHIRIIMLGPNGWLFVNGNYVDKLRLGGWLEPGRVFAVAGYFSGDGVDGESTRYRNFTIWSIETAP